MDEIQKGFESSKELVLHKPDSLVKRGLDLLEEKGEVKPVPEWMSMVWRKARYAQPILFPTFISNKVDPTAVSKTTIAPWFENIPFMLLVMHHLFENPSCFSFDNNYTLDFIYAYDEQGGEPLVYSRHKDEKPIASVEEYLQRYNLIKPERWRGDDLTAESARPILGHINNNNQLHGEQLWKRTDEEFYFRFAVDLATIRQFFLMGDSILYNRWLIYSEADKQFFINRQVGLASDKDAAMLASINATPMLTLKTGYADITFLCYKYPLGYTLGTYRLVWPNQFLGVHDRVVLSGKVMENEEERCELRSGIMDGQLDLESRT